MAPSAVVLIFDDERHRYYTSYVRADVVVNNPWLPLGALLNYQDPRILRTLGYLGDKMTSIHHARTFSFVNEPPPDECLTR